MNFTRQPTTIIVRKMKTCRHTSPRKKHAQEGGYTNKTFRETLRASLGRPRKDVGLNPGSNQFESRPFCSVSVIQYPQPLFVERTPKDDEYVKQAPRMEGPFTFSWFRGSAKPRRAESDAEEEGGWLREPHSPAAKS